ncbi:uncharacterized protein LOC101860258 [Aplysia californica]|uniref:Uncharacterized protein LOC101860258 n=1 Tax=Aplysia californica TaxID=6500 RepID=A0ABM0JTX2_APLCA|nr:uncharacterized protein LOC101860258 [Aplysia californica]
MDFIRTFEVELDRQVYYAGEMLTGHVYLEVEENMRIQNIRVFLRGKAHAEWKITRAGERRAMKQDEHYMDERLLLWGKDDSDPHQGIPILSRGRHRYPFHFQLPDTTLPCSFESKIGNVRYYVRVTVNIPYASCPQCIRYFSIIGPNIDCVDERFLVPVQAVAKRNSCSLCCGKGPLLLRASLERTSFVCGEPIKLKAEVQNGGDSEVWVLCKLIQYVEFFINKGVLGLSKEVRHTVLEAESDKVPPHDTAQLDELMNRLIVPVMPPTMIEVCGLVQIYYTLKLYLETSKGKGDAAEINMPITIATVPFRIPNAPPPDILYESANPNVEGGMYISPEFQLGQVYMGEEVDPETTILYRPMYVCVTGDRPSSNSDAHLLQVPSRQACRSRENVRGSREALQENIICSQNVPQQQQMVKLFQVHDEGGESSRKAGKPVVEDKFLKEITAKIANRQVNGNDDEDKSGVTSGSPPVPCEIESQVHLMRKQLVSKDNVHKALVNELRKHLSEDEGAEKPHPGLKKVPLKKVPDSSGAGVEYNKHLKTEGDKGIGHMPSAVPEFPSHKDQQHGDIGQSQAMSSEVHTSSLNSSLEHAEKLLESMSELEDQEVEVEYSEHSALISTREIVENMDVEVQKMEKRASSKSPVSDFRASYDESMQQYIEELPSPAEELLSTPTAPLILSDMTMATDNTEGSTIDSNPVVSVQPMSSAANRNSSSSMHTDSAGVGGERMVRSQPQVAPKPKQGARHSFPASGAFISESGELTVQVTTRPKSQVVEGSRSAQDEVKDSNA